MMNNTTQLPPFIQRVKFFSLLTLLFLWSNQIFAQANDLCTGAEVIACGAVVNATTTGASTDAAIGTCNTDLTTAPGVWYEFAGTGDDITASLCGTTAYDSKIGVFEGSCAALTCVIGEDDDFGNCGENDPEVEFASVVGTTYFIYVTGFGTNAGDFTLSLTCTTPPPVPSNDLCANADLIACGDVVNATTTGASVDATIGTCNTSLTTAAGVWYEFVGTGDDVTASLCGTTAYDSKIGVFEGSCAALTCVIGEDDDFGNCGENDPEVEFASVVGTTYYIYVTGFGANEGDFTLSLTCVAPPPPPANDLCGNAIAITGEGAIAGTNVAGTTTDAPPTCVTTLNTSAGVWYSYEGDGSIVTVDLCGSSDDTKIGVFSGSCAALTCVDGEDDDFTVCGGNDPSVTFTADAGTDYFIYVTSFGTDSEEPFTLNVAIVGPPMAVCQPAVVNLDANGIGSITVANVDGGSTADAGIASIAITAGTTDYTCANVGTPETVTLTVTDNNGMTSTCDAMVMVVDVAPPTVTATPVTVNILPDETVILDEALLGIVTGDNCGVLSVAISPNSLTQANEGLNVIMITVTDSNGIPTIITVNVTVNNFTPLDIFCRQPVSTCNVEGQCGRGDMIILEPYVPDDMNLVSLTNNAPTFFPVGTTEIIWTALSADGITSQCISQVIISDEEGPTIDCPGNVVKFLPPNSCTVNFFLDVAVTDNCGVESVTGTGFQNLGIGLYPTEIVATDINGNTTTCTATIAVHDETSPEIVSCPDDVTVTAPLGAESIPVFLPQPVITDACGVSLMNDAPATFDVGTTTTVNWKGMDDYGNWVMCTYDVTVNTAATVVGAMAPIEASTEGENARVSWNAPSILSYCEACADTDVPDYQYLGDYNGHQYYLYTIDAVNEAQAQDLAAAMGGALVTINTAGENDFLRGELADFTENILVQTTNDFANFPADVIPIEMPETVVFNNEGLWNFADASNTYYFVSEKACADFTQTGPIVDMPNIYGENVPTLLTPGSEWPAGEYVVTYELTDACGASQTHNFDVTVDEPVANYCTTGSFASDLESVWIENVVLGDFVNASTQADAGYADYSALEGLKFIVNEGQMPLSIAKLTPGGNTAGEMLYWTIWADTNADGDFFDEEALVQVSGVGTVAAEFNIPAAEVYDTKLRVMVSRYEFCQPCGNVIMGEAEDYNVTISNAAVVETRSEKDTDVVELTTSVYPNPVSETAVLAIGDLPSGYLTVSLIDNLGRILEIRNYEGMGNERLMFDVSNYASGLLIFRLTQDGEVMDTQRVVKK